MANNWMQGDGANNVDELFAFKDYPTSPGMRLDPSDLRFRACGLGLGSVRVQGSGL